MNEELKKIQRYYFLEINTIKPKIVDTKTQQTSPTRHI